MSHNDDDREDDLARPKYREQSASYMEIVEDTDVIDQTETAQQPQQDGTGTDALDSLTLSETNRQNSNSTIRPEVIQDVVGEDIQLNYVESQSRRSSHHSEQSASDLSQSEVTDESKQELQRIVQLIFDLEPSEEIIEKSPAWLLKSIMLQGQIFITTKNLCFHSYFPRHKDVILRSGYLIKKSRTSQRQHRHWFILQNTTLSYYNDASDIYYSAGNIDLTKAVDAVADVEHSARGQFAFRLITATREYFLRADTASSANEWIKVIKKVIFQSQNLGDSVLLRIPLSQVVDIELCDIVQFAPTLRVSVSTKDESYAVQEYHWTLLIAADLILDTLRQQLQASQTGGKSILDTSHAARAYERPPILESVKNINQVPNIEVFAEGLVKDQGHGALDQIHIGNPFSFLNNDSNVVNTSRTDTKLESKNRTSSPSRSLASSVSNTLRGVANVATAVLPTQIFTHKGKNTPEQDVEDEEAAKAFRREFALPESTRLLKTFDAYHQHTVPLPGSLYIGSTHVAFHSSAPGSKLRLLIPMADIESAVQEKGIRFPFSGLILSIKAHETLQFEFVHSADRDQCVAFINGSVDNTISKSQQNEGHNKEAEAEADRARDLHEKLDKAVRAAGMRREKRRPPLENVLDAPPVVFDSPNASMVAFKPLKQLRFTCLTIGSRGDVQPYVALCKGLIADGQKAKIATHEEFRDFVEGHGIEFVPIDGNPEELMAICVEHGMFTYSFLKEASQKFRGWIDELLKSAWKACQNTDILIESPSAMAGIHIAEALGIPYYRAFTMPWSKTKVYPHAFAVPDNSKGGTYNMLTYSAFDLLFWKAISGQVNRWRKKSLNLPATNFDKLAQHKVPFLYNFSPYVVPPALDWPDWIRVTGYWFLDNPDDKADSKWEAPKEVTDFIEHAKSDHKKLAYIGFGSIVVSDPEALTKAVIEAVNKSGVRCILVKGWSERANKDDKDDTKQDKKKDQDYGENVLALDSIPHDWLFPQMNVVCHHGGAGSLGASLRAGIPTIVKPFFGDQHFFGDRVQNLGVGICLKKLTVKRLREALETCCTDKLIIQKARKIGEQIRNERGVDYAIENIYRDLEYAKSLVKAPRQAAPSEHSDDSWVIEDMPDTSDADDEDLFDTKTDEHGHVVSILKSIKDLRLPNPLGSRSGHYNLSGISLFKHKAEVFKLKAIHL